MHLMDRLRRASPLVASVFLFSACGGSPQSMPRNVSIGTSPHAAALRLPPDAAPRLIRVAFSSLDVARGDVWRGTFVTSTNVASVEVRSNLFSINVPKVGVGRFAFGVGIYVVPPIFLRAYRLRIIARNANGIAVEEDAPFRIR